MSLLPDQAPMSVDDFKIFLRSKDASFTIILPSGKNYAFKIHRRAAHARIYGQWQRVGIISKDYERVYENGKYFETELFARLWRAMPSLKAWPAKTAVWHEGICGRCGAALTNPISIRCGLGPVCRGKVGRQ